MKDQSKYDFEIKEHIGTIYTSPGGWTTELNVVSWDGKAVLRILQRDDGRVWRYRQIRTVLPLLLL